jgi:nucleoside-diphosphate-sugar epimerase
MRVLVTGAAGFIGSHVIEAFSGKGHEIFAVTRERGGIQRREETPGDVRVVELELMNFADVCFVLRDIRPHLTIHLAWCTQPGKCWSAPKKWHTSKPACNWRGASVTLAAEDWWPQALARSTKLAAAVPS